MVNRLGMIDRQIDIRKEEAGRWWDAHQKTLEYSKEFGHTTVRSLILINGGAIVVILTAITNIVGKKDDVVLALVQNFAFTIYFFTTGLILAVGAAGVAYLDYLVIASSMPSLHELRDFVAKGSFPDRRRSPLLSKALMYCTIALVVLSVVALIFGAYYSVKAFSGAYIK